MAHHDNQLQPVTARDWIALRAATTDMDAWYAHIAPAAACTRPVCLVGQRSTLDSVTGNLLSLVDTTVMPDGMIYKACGTRLASVCPGCARTYQRDAYQLLRAGLVGGKGIPGTVAGHPAVFVTLTAPSFGHVHTRVVGKHTCTHRRRCDCRPNPCRARTTPTSTVPAGVDTYVSTGLCEHGNPAVCWARHEPEDPSLGQPLCPDCYDHDHHVVWNLYSGELWRRTKQAAERYLAALAEVRGISPVVAFNAAGKLVRRPPVRLSHGKAAEMQRRAAIHFHALLRLDGVDPHDPDAIVPPPAGFTTADLEEAIRAAVAQVAFTAPTHPDRPEGWPIAWGDPDKGFDVKHIILSGSSAITDDVTGDLATEMTADRAAGYLAKYATKSTEVTGHTSARITEENLRRYANLTGDHTARLIDACWRLGRPSTTPTTPLPLRIKALGQRWICPGCGTPTRLKACLTCPPTPQPRVASKPPGNRPVGERDNPYARLRRWAHKLGYGGHFLTKARRYTVTFGFLRAARINFRRTGDGGPADPMRTAEHAGEETTLVVGTLSFAGIGWHSTGDAILAATSAAMARARAQAAKDELAHELGSALRSHVTLAA